MTTALHGRSLIGGGAADGGGPRFEAIDPATGAPLGPGFHEATAAEVDAALAAAAAAFDECRRLPPTAVASLLEAIGAELLARGPALVARARAETALAQARLEGELQRTVGQLRLFAGVAREGSWVEARIDRALPERQPLPRPDLRRMLVPIGPVAVFGASNFPLAFSVAGGDTAAALAAGNPVVVKAHPAHPGTSELAAGAIVAAARAAGVPPGVFALLHGPSPAVGLALVRHPRTRAVAFTGSLAGGRALFDAAAARPEPIPVYAEMGSVNPVFLLPGALAERGPAIGRSLVDSVTLGVGQFCTNPGLVFAVRDAAYGAFLEAVATATAAVAPGTMLTRDICDRYRAGVIGAAHVPGVRVVVEAADPDAAPTRGAARVLATDLATWLARPALHHEVFGPSTLLVECDSVAAFVAAAQALEGQLTATVHGTAAELAGAGHLVDALAQRVGRLLCNGFPTGVEVTHAMQHGGPYPATTDARTTSVGSAAIGRFARPVCFQNAPAALLPPALRDENPLGIWRLVDGEWTRAGLA
ncbi:MAG: aldehyde dehydrogenase (NADP(+)) [Gemmatimonadales bacterium]|jgi:NADP-dependent aldehyde dehydrogenase|nr:aldehyde dehydrogenase (NADP(+)) [Gemmatimonadales bacterium]